jgi:hypothetical protein
MTGSGPFRLGPRPRLDQDNPVRVASWVFVLCAVLGAVGVFLPSIELQVSGSSVSKRTDLSLYKVASDRERARWLLARYHGSSKRKVGADLLRKVSPHVGGRVRSAIGDARDAMDTLDDVSDDDLRTAGIALIATLSLLLGLEALITALVVNELVRGSYRRSRYIIALIASLLVTAIAIALHLACREAVWEANDEVSRTILSLGPAAYLIPITAIASLLLAIGIIRKLPAGYTVRTKVV